MSAGRGITCWRVNPCSLVAMASVHQVWMALCEAFDERGGSPLDKTSPAGG